MAFDENGPLDHSKRHPSNEKGRSVNYQPNKWPTWSVNYTIMVKIKFFGQIY